MNLLRADRCSVHSLSTDILQDLPGWTASMIAYTRHMRWTECSVCPTHCTSHRQKGQDMHNSEDMHRWGHAPCVLGPNMHANMHALYAGKDRQATQGGLLSAQGVTASAQQCAICLGPLCSHSAALQTRSGARRHTTLAQRPFLYLCRVAAARQDPSPAQGAQ